MFRRGGRAEKEYVGDPSKPTHESIFVGIIDRKKRTGYAVVWGQGSGPASA